MSEKSSLIISIGLVIGLLLLGVTAGNAALDYRAMERTVVVKGLAEQEYPANVVIWPIPYQVVGNSLEQLYIDVDRNKNAVLEFLRASGIPNSEISITIVQVVDKFANDYGASENIKYRYTANQSVTVYSRNVDVVRSAMGRLDTLGREGVPLTGADYNYYTQYLFSDLNAVKPAMIEQATANARAVAQKFAEDSTSELGKIKSARQGQFSIADRDSNNPHIKNVRVVTTVEYYLAD
jgi:uncharacterized protein